ncbi:rRNA (cytidine-2'-O-)-methyltransferase RsmI [Psychroflexus torquis ATCC 700755]|uniref:Ribosomal RNA small subunit methyltransferase I n=1 Tax=Psychroflexus torquis (strain ATCC 700755 / CIP 106069 / ACAM 623) TaxID=313595 RepID=K4IEL8_PSYTT|nr:16S rRNA (cytidine(1402)-2'-O)-methyltransferase [Psychroflexus torquis]AFU68864.1 rRNA (cytidine-2'-O-)-methyltransferase RsmI [Psychroflexus torquis ATCC 700755]
MAKLYLVPTPIGNLGDMTFRAVEVLKSVNVILAEDTRVSGILLKHYEIDTPMQSYHQHNEHSMTESVVKQIKRGRETAIITDAGTPGISDPGFLLSRACAAEGVEIQCLPGATAFVPALVNSGLPNDKFVFEGFLPAKKGRQKRLKALSSEDRTMIFYESPYKILKTLQQFTEHFGSDREVSISREISKIYEETLHGTLDEMIAHFDIKKPKGEFVIVLAGSGVKV